MEANIAEVGMQRKFNIEGNKLKGIGFILAKEHQGSKHFHGWKINKKLAQLKWKSRKRSRHPRYLQRSWTILKLIHFLPEKISTDNESPLDPETLKVPQSHLVTLWELIISENLRKIITKINQCALPPSSSIAPSHPSESFDFSILP